jgi:hypothetical protein
MRSCSAPQVADPQCSFDTVFNLDHDSESETLTSDKLAPCGSIGAVGREKSSPGIWGSSQRSAESKAVDTCEKVSGISMPSSPGSEPQAANTVGNTSCSEQEVALHSNEDWDIRV